MSSIQPNLETYKIPHVRPSKIHFSKLTLEAWHVVKNSGRSMKIKVVFEVFFIFGSSHEKKKAYLEYTHQNQSNQVGLTFIVPSEKKCSVTMLCFYKSEIAKISQKWKKIPKILKNCWILIYSILKWWYRHIGMPQL